MRLCHNPTSEPVGLLGSTEFPISGSNHIHAIPGDHVEELRVICKLLDVDYDGFGGAA